MNRKDWRRKTLKRLSAYTDTDTEFITDCNERLDEAQKRLAGDVPAIVMPDKETVYLWKDRTDVTMLRKMAATTDLWVLDLGITTTLGALAPMTDGTWDGVMHLEITDPTGIVHRRQAREFFTRSVPPFLNYAVTLDRPWRNTTDTNMAFRIYQPEFFLRDDVMQLLDGAIWDASHSYLGTLPEAALAYRDETDFRGDANGRPEKMHRGRRFQLDAPATAPVAALDTGDNPAVPWLGPHPIGTYRFLYTYAWGKKVPEYAAPQGSFDPVWESSPSPISNALVMSGATMRILLSKLPNIDFMQNFDPVPAALRNGHSGIYKRIYVIIDAVNTAGPFVDDVEALAVPTFLGEVSGEVVTFTWDGSVIPEYKRRCPESQGYFAYSMYPHQDEDFEVDFRVRRRVRNLGHDYDAPNIDPDGEEALLALGRAYIAQMLKNDVEAEKALAWYEQTEKPRLLAHKSSPAEVVPPRPWGYNSLAARRDPWWGRQKPFTS